MKHFRAFLAAMAILIAAASATASLGAQPEAKPEGWVMRGVVNDASMHYDIEGNSWVAQIVVDGPDPTTLQLTSATSLDAVVLNGLIEEDCHVEFKVGGGFGSKTVHHKNLAFKNCPS